MNAALATPTGPLGRVPTPTRLAWGTALVACGLALVSLPAALVGLLAIGLVVWLDGRATLREPELEVHLHAPGRVGQGQAVELTVELFDPGTRARPFELAVDLDPTLAGPEALAIRRARTQPNRPWTLPLALHARRRGRRRVEAVQLRVTGPLGLAWTRLRAPLAREIRVVPGLREVLAHQSRAALHLRRGSGRRRSRQRGEGGVFESLREYVRGDDPRTLDWKATARRGHPMVRRFEAERSQQIVLALDCGRLMAERFDELERLDHALAGAVVLSKVAESWGDHVGLLAFADSISRLVKPGSYPASRLVDELSEVEARSVEPDYPRAMLTLSRELRRRSLIVVFTDVVDDEVSEPLAAHLSILTRRHLPLLVAMRNPSLFAAAGAPVESVDGAYRRAAAAELVGARRTSLERLRRAGVQVIDIEPQQSVMAAVDAYLEIKLRGRL